MWTVIESIDKDSEELHVIPCDPFARPLRPHIASWVCPCRPEKDEDDEIIMKHRRMNDIYHAMAPSGTGRLYLCAESHELTCNGNIHYIRRNPLKINCPDCLRLLGKHLPAPWQTGYPPDSKPVLAVTIADVVRSDRKRRAIVRAQYIRHKEIEVEGWDDTDGVDWYNEMDDCYYIKEGWYELIDYWEDYGYIAIPDPIVAWMPMPELPENQDA
jgi:hypothetical protein